MNSHRSLALTTALLLVPGFGARAAEDGQEFAFEDLARGLAEEQGLGEDATFDGVLHGPNYVSLGVGGFDVYYPVAGLGKGAYVDLFKASLVTLIEVQRTWHDWRETPPTSEDIDEDWDTLRKWIKGWSPSKLSGVQGGASLLEQLASKDEIRAASERLREFTVLDADTAAYTGERLPLVLEPTREHYVRAASLAGLLEEHAREQLWKDITVERTASWVNWTQIACLEQVGWPFDIRNPYVGRPHSQDDPLGFEQFIAERIAVVLLRQQYFQHGTHFFEEAMGTNLVIAATGKNDLRQGAWKLEYKTAGGSTQPYERFVPGGNPNGGTLPPRKAFGGPKTGSAMEISLYRRGGGEEFFRDALKEGQKRGAKLASKDKENPLRRDKTAHFELFSFEISDSHAVTAPFLGSQGEGKALPPNEFLDDYEDFFRAYRSCFFEWLRTHGVEDENDEDGDSQSKFAEFVAAQARRELGSPMYLVIEQVYGVPLSSPSPEEPALEWRFLEWLKSGR